MDPVIPENGEPVVDPTAAALEKMESMLDQRFSDVTSKLNEFDAKLTEASKPAEPEAPQSGWKPESWDDIPRLVEEKGQEVANRVIEERESKAREFAENERKAREDIDKQIDSDFDRITKAGKWEDDPDKKKELFGYMAFAGTMNMEAAAATLALLHDQGQNFDYQSNSFVKSTNDQSGREIPINTGRKTPSASSNGPTYKDIHNLSMDQLVERFSNIK